MKHKNLALVCALLSVLSAVAAEWFIPSPTVVGNDAAVIALTNALAQANKSDVITLSNGVYDVSGVVSHTDAEKGDSHLLVTKKLHIRGDPDFDREEVVLRGGDSIRIIRLGQSSHGVAYSPVFENMTFTNGHSSVWGGAMGYDGGNIGDCAYVTNCVFRGCISKSAGAIRGATVSNCLFENNRSTGGYAGVCARAYAYDCVFSNNVSATSGGALNQSSAYESLFVGNRAEGEGALGGAISECGEIVGCTFRSNYAKGCGSAAAGSLTSVSNCLFVGNNAGTGAVLSFSGKSNEPTVVDCRFYNNWGSGAISGVISGNDRTQVFDCVFTNNASASSRGVGNGVALWSNCTFVANSVRTTSGSGLRQAGIAGVSTNYSLCVARNCMFRDNFCTSTTYRQDPTLPCERSYKAYNSACAAYMTLIDCTVEDAFYNCVAERCVITNAPAKSVAVVCGTSVLTNCLIAANHLEDASVGVFAHLEAFAGDPRLVNCTVADNSFGSDKFMFHALTNGMVVNTLFYGNRRGESGCDVICNRTDGIALTNCLYQYKKVDGSSVKAISVDVNPVVLAADETPRFNAGRNPAFPYYMPLKRSKAVDAGVSVGFSADDVDLGGYPRLRGAAVDIGAYECWVPPFGMIMVVR